MSQDKKTDQPAWMRNSRPARGNPFDTTYYPPILPAGGHEMPSAYGGVRGRDNSNNITRTPIPLTTPLNPSPAKEPLPKKN
jgi:hypothetical protein